MSKSLGNVIDPFQVIDIYGVDALRYYLLAAVGFGQDGSRLDRGGSSRATTRSSRNQYGNLASRTFGMIRQYRDGVVPAAEVDPELASAVRRLGRSSVRALRRHRADAGARAVWASIRRLNQYVQERAPWKLAKDEGAAAELDTVLYTLAEGLRVVALLSAPVLPETRSDSSRRSDTQTCRSGRASLGAVAGGAQLGELGQLFPKVERRAEPP